MCKKKNIKGLMFDVKLRQISFCQVLWTLLSIGQDIFWVHRKKLFESRHIGI